MMGQARKRRRCCSAFAGAPGKFAAAAAPTKAGAADWPLCKKVRGCRRSCTGRCSRAAAVPNHQRASDGQGGRWRCRSGGSRERLLHRVCTAAERLCRRGASRAFSGLAVLRPAGVPTALRRRVRANPQMPVRTGRGLPAAGARRRPPCRCLRPRAR